MVSASQWEKEAHTHGIVYKLDRWVTKVTNIQTSAMRNKAINWNKTFFFSPRINQGEGMEYRPVVVLDPIHAMHLGPERNSFRHSKGLSNSRKKVRE